MTEKTVPPLPCGSVDLAAVHEAAAKGKDLAKAIEDATTRVEPKPAPKAKADAAPPAPPADAG